MAQPQRAQNTLLGRRRSARTPIGPGEQHAASFNPQGCSTLFTESHGKDGFETAERCGVAVLGDRIGLVDPQDIVGEAAHSREDAGIFSNARRVFT